MNFIMLHAVGYEARPRGHEPDHYQAICDEMRKRGNVQLSEDRANDCDVLLFNSDVWHIDAEKHTSPYNQNVLQVVLRKHTPVVWFDMFDHSGDINSQGRWPGTNDWMDCKAGTDGDWQKFGYAMSRQGACPLLYFMRKMQMHQEYPAYVHPLEHPIIEDFPLVSKEELNARPFDVCGLANLSGPRLMAIKGLTDDGRLKLDCRIILHYERYDYKVWLDHHRAAKMFLDADASLGSERSLRLITIAPRLRIKSDHRIPFPLVDMVHHVEIGGYDGQISKADVDKVLSVVNDPELLYKIYVAGAEHTRRHYSLDARSKYVCDLVERFVAGQL